MSLTPSRRSFALAAVLSAAGLWLGARLPFAFSQNAGTSVAAAPLVDRLAALFTDREDARAVGRAYLEAHPAEARQQPLFAAFADLDRAQSTEALRRAFAEIREADFRTGNIVFVHGWVLARCEARLCALVALS